MKKLTTPLLIFLSNLLFAQAPTQQKATVFDKFINKPEIEWAAYINDTNRFEQVHLNKILLIRFAKKEIKASLPVGSGSFEANQVKYLNKKDIDRVKFSSSQVAVYDSVGNMTGVQNVIPQMDTASFTLTDITQILYVEKGQLKTYIPWLATMYPVVTSTGIYLGDGDYFSTCFNYRYNYLSPKQNKITWLAKTNRRISLDSFDVRNKLKELYGRNIAETLWPYILNSKIAAFDYKTNKRLKSGEFTTDLITEEKIMVPVYDSTGNQVGEVVKRSELTPDVFTSIQLVQDWYYDYTGNVVFTTAREMYLYAKKWKPTGEAGNPEPVLKLVFQ